MKTIIVCGCSKGIGAAVVEKLLSQSYNIIGLARTKGELSEKVLKNPKFKLMYVDFENSTSVANIIETIFNEKSIYGLINNASGPTSLPFIEAGEELYLKYFRSHLFISDKLTKLILPILISNKIGRIVNIISVTAKVPLENMIISNTLRGAMLNWSKTLSKEVGKYGITVNNVLPGYTKTSRLNEIINATSEINNKTPKECEKILIEQIPMRRFGESSEIANVVAFLAGNESSFVNGVSIPVDGGWTPNS